MTSVELLAARLRQSVGGSFSFSWARWALMTTIRELKRRSVSEMPSEAAAESAAVTPGTISYGTRADSRASRSSASRPKSPGSPLFRRTTLKPRRAEASMRRLISDWVMFFVPQRLPTLMTIAWGLASARIGIGTRSSWRITSAARISAWAFTVSKPGSPGPAPTKETLPWIKGFMAAPEVLTSCESLTGYRARVRLHLLADRVADAREDERGDRQIRSSAIRFCNPSNRKSGCRRGG